MPKKTKKRKKRRARKDRFPLGLYLVIASLCAGIIWLVSLPMTPPTQEMAKKVELQDQQEPEAVIEQVASQLGIAPRKVDGTAENKKKKYELPIDRSKMDLTYANMIVKSELEKRGARQTAGKAEDNRQVLTFNKGDKKVEVDLYYAKKPDQSKDSGRTIAIVVDDFGSTGGELLQGFLTLPREITFAIFPGMANSVKTMNQAGSQGRETLIHIPMEPIDYPMVNPGEHPILVQMEQAEVERIINRAFSELPNCLGINNHMGSLATTDPAAMGHVMEALKKRNKIFLDSRTSNVSVAYQTAQKARIGAYRNDLFLDSPDISDATLDRKLEQIRKLAGPDRSVIAITHCHSSEKLLYLRKVITRLQGEGFKLIPLSQIGKYNVPLIM